jgi:hypothetical protein
MTLVSYWVLDPPFLFVTPALSLLDPDGRVSRQAHRRFIVQALWHSAATKDQVDAAVATFLS